MNRCCWVYFSRHKYLLLLLTTILAIAVFYCSRHEYVYNGLPA